MSTPLLLKLASHNPINRLQPNSQEPLSDLNRSKMVEAYRHIMLQDSVQECVWPRAIEPIAIY